MEQFTKDWLGKRVDFDHVFAFQCVDLIKQYLYQKFGIKAGAWGDAKNYWLNTNPAILIKFDRLQTTDVRAGDIVPLKPVDDKPAHREGHIGIATGAQTLTHVEILEQNGSTGNGSGTGNDAIRKRFVPKTRIYGVLRPKGATPPSTHPLAGAVGKTVYLRPVTAAWRVYAVGSLAPRNKVATLNPIKYQPMTYKILAVDKMPNSVVIETKMYGKVSLPLDKDAEIRQS